MIDDTGRQETDREPLTGEAGTTDAWGMTRRDLFLGVGQAAVVGMSVPSLALLGACATPQPEPWADGTFWSDGTGWIE